MQGRTGVMVCCYILHSRHLPNAEKSLEFYGQTRTNNKKANIPLLAFFSLSTTESHLYAVIKYKKPY